MVHLEKESKSGKTYLRLSHRIRINGKSRRVWSIWLGREDKILEQTKIIKLSEKPDFKISSFDYGLPVILMKMTERLDLINIINNTTNKRDQGLSVGEYMMIATLNRCIKPKSKNQIRKWFYSTYLQYLFSEINTYLDSMAYTNHFSYLTDEVIDEIYIKINEKLLTEFKVEMNELMFDPTNFFTFINPKRENQKLPGHGHSKEGRHNLNLINLSLFCTRDGGIPIMYCTYAGGTNDATHFKMQYPKFIKRLQKLGISAPTIILVFDNGNISPEVFKALDEAGLNWICSVRKSTQKDLDILTADDFPMFKLPNKKKVGVIETKRPMFSKAALKNSNVPDYKNPKRRLLILYNPERAKWNGNNLKQKLQARVDEVNRFFEGSEKRLTNTRRYPKWRDLDNVKIKIKNIIAANKKEEYLDYVSYQVNKSGDKITFKIEINEDALRDYIKKLGKSYYMTNHPTMSGPKVIWSYRQQFNIERAFSYLKSPNSLSITPMNHYIDDSIRGHVFTCVLGLLLLTLITRDVKKEFPELNQNKIWELFSEIRAAKIKFPDSPAIIKKLIDMSPEAKKLADFYNLESYL